MCQTNAVTAVGDETRARILDAAWQEVSRRSTAEVTIAQVAAAAGVTRQLVYFHFANRAGLLTAMARHRDETSGFGDRVREAVRTMPPVEGLEHLLRSWCAYVPEIAPVSLALEAALVSGDEGGSAWRDRFGELRDVLGIAFSRIARHELLTNGWTVESAADWAWSRVQPSTWHHLVEERDWDHETFVERTVGSLLDELVVRSARPDR
jgi:AcrR family transcriptional regulator